MMVVLSHIYAAAGYPYLAVGAVAGTLDFLHSGVDLFFVLSGFCLYYPLTRAGSTTDWAEFFRRRARRLLPPYYAAIAALVLLPFILEPLAHQAGLVTTPAAWPEWHQLWTHLLLIHTLGTDTFFGLNGPFWSLGLEVQFYLAFPLAVWLVHRYEWRGLCVIAGVTLGARIACTSGAFPPYQPIDLADLFPSRWFEFGLGMLAASRLRRSSGEPVRGAHELGDLLGGLCLFLLVAYVLYGPLRQWPYQPKDWLFACCYSALLYLSCSRGSRIGALLGRQRAVRLGTISYSLYLIHLPIIFAVGPSIVAWHLGQLPCLLVMAALCVPLAIACAATFFYLFERPFLNRPHATTGGGQPKESNCYTGEAWRTNRAAAVGLREVER